jgi:hypothetical protein
VPPPPPAKDTSSRDGLAVGIPLSLIFLGAGVYVWKAGVPLSSLLPSVLTPPQAGSSMPAVSMARVAQLGGEKSAERVPILAKK